MSDSLSAGTLCGILGNIHLVTVSNIVLLFTCAPTFLSLRPLVSKSISPLVVGSLQSAPGVGITGVPALVAVRTLLILDSRRPYRRVY